MVDRVDWRCRRARASYVSGAGRARPQKANTEMELAEFLRKGYQRVKVDGAFVEIARRQAALDQDSSRHDIDVVVDRLAVRGDIGTRLCGFARAMPRSWRDGLAVELGRFVVARHRSGVDRNAQLGVSSE